MTAPASYSIAAPAGSMVQGGFISQAQPMQSVQYMTAPAQQGGAYSYANYDPGTVGAVPASSLFDQFDRNGDGRLTREEMQSAMQSQVGSQFLVPRGSMAYASPNVSGAMTPPMAPGYNPYNPFQSGAAVPAAAW